MAAAASEDRFGLSWRGALAAGILTHLDRIDCVEVIADDYVGAGRRKVDGLVALARQVPVSLHSIQLGLCSLEGIPPERLAGVARLIDRVQPAGWSEHLAFVRGGGREIGHLAPQSRTPGTVSATLGNLATVENLVGLKPAVENIATLVDPPGSTLTEARWLGGVLAGCTNPVLLDLHNVHTNALNFGFEAREFVAGLPLERVTTIHLAGGRPFEDRWLDDHKNPVPGPVFELLEFVAARVRTPLTVILERDGAFEGVEPLLNELDAARAAVDRGRARPVDHAPVAATALPAAEYDHDWQARLAEAYVSGELPGATDERGLALAARGFAKKRARLEQAIGSPSLHRSDSLFRRASPPPGRLGPWARYWAP